MSNSDKSDTLGGAPAEGPFERLRKTSDTVRGNLAPDVSAALNFGMMRLYNLISVEGVADDDPSVTAIVEDLEELLTKS